MALGLSDESTQVLEKAQQLGQPNPAKASAVTVVKPLTQVYGGLDVAPIASGASFFRRLYALYEFPATEKTILRSVGCRGLLIHYSLCCVFAIGLSTALAMLIHSISTAPCSLFTGVRPQCW